MKCRNCGAEGDGKYCEHCGTPLTQQAVQEQASVKPVVNTAPPTAVNAAPPTAGYVAPPIHINQTKKQFYKKWWFWVIVAVVVIVVISIAASIGNKGKGSSNPPAVTSSQSKTSGGSSSSSKSKASSKASTISFNKTLTSGFYTVGVDIPAGTYKFTAAAGGGNVMTNDGSINEVMGISSKSSSVSMYSAQYSNAKLTNGMILSVSGVTLQIASSNASGTPLKARSQSITKTEQYSDGKYVSGKDFPAGTYDIAVVSGSGNVTDDDSDLFGMLNAIMGADKSNDMFEQNYYNVNFKSGVTLNISGGVTITLSPSK